MSSQPRKGVALLMVLGVLTITLAIGYTMIRTAGLGLSVETNLDRQARARAAAATGLSLALRKMHLSTWSGVNTEFHGELDDGVQFTATYSAGDPTLQPGDTDYARLPYRVTVRSVGTAEHPLHPQVPATEEVSAVVELIPRKVQDASARNLEAQPFAVYQWGSQALELDLPARIEGAVYTQGQFEFLKSYPVESLRPYSGYVDEIALFSKALNASQIQSLFGAAAANNAPAIYTAFQPAAWWRFDEAVDATVASDAQNFLSGRYASAKAGQTLVPFPAANRSALLDGINDNIRFGNYQPGGSRMTLLAWFRPERFSNSTVRLVSSSSDTSDWSHDWALNIIPRDGGHRLRFQWRTQFGQAAFDATAALTLQQWTFAAVVLDGTSLSLYQNGLPAGQTSIGAYPNFTSSSRVMIGDSFPGSSRSQLLRDQYQRYLDGQTDERVLTGALHVPSTRLTDEARTLCADDLKITIQPISTRTDAPLAMPLNVASYRLYAGGPLYSVPQVSGTLQSQQLVADPATNPLGLFLVRGDATLDDDVKLQGTLLFDSVSARLRVRGDRIQAASVSLPLLEGEDRPRQLPLAFVPAETLVEDSASLVSFRGQWLTGTTFEFQSANAPMAMQLEGSLVAQRLRVRKRNNWTESEFVWRWILGNFLSQNEAVNGIRYFPQYLAGLGLETGPVFTVRPHPDNPLGYLWPDFSRPLIEAHPDDPGLRWQLVSLSYND